MNNKLTVADVDLADKTVLLRVDFNVPFKPGSMEISDLTRMIGMTEQIEVCMSLIRRLD